MVDDVGPRSSDRSVSTGDLAARLHRARMRTLVSGAYNGDAEDELDVLLSRVAAVYANAVTEETRTAYSRRWLLFTTWCAARGYESLPASPEIVMIYCTDAMGDAGVALSTLRGWIAAINRVHVEAGLRPPGKDPAMTLFVRGLSRMVPSKRRPDRVKALRIGPLREVCRSIDSGAIDPTEVRDRAILGLSMAGIGDAEMTRLRWHDVRLRDRSMQVTLQPIGRQRRQRIKRLSARTDESACPVVAMIAWRRLIQDPMPDAPVFSLVDGGRILGETLRDKRVFAIRKSRLNSLGRGQRATPQAAMRLLGTQPPLNARDKAILLLGFAGAFRRKEVTELRWSDLHLTVAGLIVHLRASKTDQEGRGRDVGIPYGRSSLTCPVTAFLTWKRRVETQLGAVDPEGKVFVHVGRAGRITHRALTPEALTRMVQTRAAAAGLEGKWGGRSLRAGFISTAADLEVPLEAIASQSRHATLDSLILYVRRDDPFRRNPAANVGL